MRQIISIILPIITLSLVSAPSHALLLPEDRADIMAHSYDGGGVSAQGPALLVRKGNDTSFSVSANYYVDNVSAASIDIEAQASAFTETRTETGLGVDYLVNDTMVSIGIASSEEPDYLAEAISINMSQEMLGGMTTLNIGYSTGEDIVMRVDTDFRDTIDRYQYSIGLSQVLTAKWIAGFNYEAITDKGYLANPYRAARVLGAYVPEVYPGTRTTEAYSLTSINYFDHRGSLRFYYRIFSDTWSIGADTMELSYNKYFGDRHLFEIGYRTYSQNAASFYSDNFSEEKDFMTRDKELSTFESNTIKFKYSFELFEQSEGFFSKGMFATSIALTEYNYDDYTHYRTGEAYSYNATVTQLMLSLWF